MTSRRTFISQFIKFISIGVLNTAIDFLVFNYLIWLFGLRENGYDYLLLKMLSFSLAVINSYIWNKYWVFRAEAERKVQRLMHVEFSFFVAVNLAGVIINTGVAYIVFLMGNKIMPDLSTNTWANIGVLIGAAAIWIFNFLGYKFWVFKK